MIHRHWATPYTSFVPENGVCTLELKNMPGNGKFEPRTYMEVANNRNYLMDVASESEVITVTADGMYPLELQYAVNNFLKAMMAVEPEKIQIRHSGGVGNNIMIDFYEKAPNMGTVKRHKKSSGHKSHGHKPAGHGHGHGHPKVMMF